MEAATKQIEERKKQLSFGSSASTATVIRIIFVKIKHYIHLEKKFDISF